MPSFLWSQFSAVKSIGLLHENERLSYSLLLWSFADVKCYYADVLPYSAHVPSYADIWGWVMVSECAYESIYVLWIYTRTGTRSFLRCMACPCACISLNWWSLQLLLLVQISKASGTESAGIGQPIYCWCQWVGQTNQAENEGWEQVSGWRNVFCILHSNQSCPQIVSFH